MIRRFALVAALSLTALASIGCSKKYEIVVESDTCWQGQINRDLVIDECNNSTYEVKGKLTEVSLTKRTQNGFLRVRIGDGNPAETSEPFGTVTVRP